VHEAADFCEFIRHPKLRADPGARPQRDMLVDREARLLVDFVGHFERLEAGFGVITGRIRLEVIALPRHNVSVETSRPPLPEADREVLRDLYAADFEAFGFDPAGPARGQ